MKGLAGWKGNNMLQEKYLNKNWWLAAGHRSIRTFFQTAAGFLTVGLALSEVDWINLLSVSLLAGILSLFTSLGTDLPELECEGNNGDLD